MPINAKPEYFIAEKKYYLAQTTAEKIAALEEMLKTAPTHKGAESLRAEIKQRLAKFRASLEKEGKQTGKGPSISIKKEGAAQVVLLSVTNAGKSLLLSKLTNAKPEVASYEYTTTKLEVGIMDYGGIKIQVIEMPPIYEGYAYKGNGPAFFSLIRNTNLIVFIIDSTKNVGEQLRLLGAECEKAQIKLDEKKPSIRIKRSGTGGITFTGRKFMRAEDEEIYKLLRENGIHNAVIDFYDYTTLEEFAEALNEGIVYMPYIIVYNKADLSGKEGISALTGKGIESLKDAIWKKLGLIRVFTKMVGKEKDWPPVPLKKGNTVEDLAKIIHKDFIKKFKFARVWGEGAKFGGQKVGRTHKLHDLNIIELHLK
ncbi:TGS domain-containing protein [Candidatus Woesearchaeota archaeon]|nr:TGS domain-containing protein [Candidatus Woesearchaeota archaeon]